MKKIFGFILFIFLMMTANCYAANFNFLVIPNDLFLDSKNDIVFQKSASLIGTDIINYYNQHPNMSAIPINKLREYLERPENYRFKKEVQNLISEYGANYTVNYATVQKLSSRFGAKQVLMINCNMDAQGYITRRTLWDALNIPGATVIDPAYRLSTQISLIDASNQVTLWHHNYQKLISSRESRMLTATMGDTSEQLEKVQKYSIKFLSPQVVQETQLALMKIDQYQNLNLRPNIVKPNYVSIDKIKIDSKRGSVKSARFITGKNQLNVLLDTEEKIKQLQKQEQIKLKVQKEKQILKFEKQKQKMLLKEAKRQAKLQTKLQLQAEKQKLLIKNGKVNVNSEENIQPIKQKKSKKPKKQKAKKTDKVKIDKVKVEEVIPNTPNISTPVDVIKNEQKLVPIIRTKPVLREIDYTINDI